ncbi:MAG: hypothetical protein NZ108_04550, partial [Bacteroidia bacterium]|nr:hypothetical protein [Bacteroidia bacterium]
NYGVYGEASGSGVGTNIGVYGTAGGSNENIAAYFEGNQQTTGWLKVGNPVSVSSIGNDWVAIYNHSFDAGTGGWTQYHHCGPLASTWVFNFTLNNGIMRYDNQGARSRDDLYSPWIWIPSGTTNINVEGHFNCSLENNFDGAFISYSTNGITYTKVNIFSFGGYPDNANGSNTNCSANDAQATWNGNVTGPFRFTLPNSVAGNWVSFRITAMEDNTNATGTFDLYGFSVYGISDASIGTGTFDAGNIYAEKNVYAGSNVLIGDVAEYFPVDEPTEPGDVIAMNPTETDKFLVSNSAFNPFVIGIHSTNPTVTINNPNTGKPVALTGRVPVKISLENGPIKIGDYLTAGSKKGTAMKANKSCYVIGRALENSESAKDGKILCLVETGWWNPNSNHSNQSSGSFYLRTGENKTWVSDPSIKEDSKVFVTFRNRPGADYWISEIKNGAFCLHLGKRASEMLAFDYFVEKASTAQQQIETVKQETDFVIEAKAKAEVKETISLAEHQQVTPPALQPQTAGYWDEVTQKFIQASAITNQTSKQISTNQNPIPSFRLPKQDKKQK